MWIEIFVKEYVTGWQWAKDIICTEPSMRAGYQIAFLKATLLKRPYRKDLPIVPRPLTGAKSFVRRGLLDG
jgi:hypothetical protein